MNKDKLGQLETDVSRIGSKDAFHVACVLVGSDDELKPGQGVMFTDTDFDFVRELKEGESPHAIVDPFLSGVENYDWNYDKAFWVILMPGTTDGVSHNFKINVEKFDAEWCCKGCS